MNVEPYSDDEIADARTHLSCDDEYDRCHYHYVAHWLATVDALRARLAAAEKDRDAAQAESAAVVCAVQELSIGAGLPSVVIGRQRGIDGVERDWAIRPEQIIGLMRAVRARVEECAAFGLGAVKSHQDIDGVRAKLAAAEAAAATAKVAAGLMRDRAEKAEARAERAEGLLGDARQAMLDVLEEGHSGDYGSTPEDMRPVVRRIDALLKEVADGR